jgi:threonine aldolase
MDGARIFNAASATGIAARDIAACADTVTFCLSKGLGAPAGSMIAASAVLIARARLYRKRLGGGMRQAGVLAAAGLIALEEMPARLIEDHANARLLAAALAEVPGVRAAEPQTNIVMVDVSGTSRSAAEISAALKRVGVLMNPVNSTTLRAVTHCDVSRDDCARAAQLFADLPLAH